MARTQVVFIVRIMEAVQREEAANRMSEQAVSTVFAPGLVPPPGDAGDGEVDAAALLQWSAVGRAWTAALLRAHKRKQLVPARASLFVRALTRSGIASSSKASFFPRAVPRSSRSTSIS